MRVPPFALFILFSREALYLNFIFLSSDSSPQGGWTTCSPLKIPLPDRRQRCASMCLIRSWLRSVPWAIWSCAFCPFQWLVLAMLRYQRSLKRFSTLCAWTMGIRVLVRRYFQSVVGYCSDYGTEWLFDEVPPLSWKAVCNGNISSSQNLLGGSAPEDEDDVKVGQI